MATALEIAKLNPNAAPVAVSEAARLAGIERTAELNAVAGVGPGRPSLVGLTRDELKAKLAEAGVAERDLKMRAAQLWHWIYFRGARSFEEMSNVGKGLRTALAERFTLERPEVVSEQVSKDGTRKWLIRMASTGPHDKGAEIECVYIPEVDRGRCASRARSAARSLVRSAIRARRSSSATSPRPRSPRS
jgi:23S rRNA (adenine2503-C2)-methyltransferase